ncbi:hypothetical protein Tco_0568334, partial [Tanacetum coccineum]
MMMTRQWWGCGGDDGGDDGDSGVAVAVAGPGSVVCDVDVDELSCFGAPELASKEQLYTEIMDDLRGSGSCIDSGSQ